MVFLIASLIILMIVFDKLRTRLVGCRKISQFSDCVLVLVLLVLNNNLPIKDIYRARRVYVDRIGETSSEKWNQKVLIRHGSDVCQSSESSIMDFFR